MKEKQARSLTKKVGVGWLAEDGLFSHNCFIPGVHISGVMPHKYGQSGPGNSLADDIQEMQLRSPEQQEQGRQAHRQPRVFRLFLLIETATSWS